MRKNILLLFFIPLLISSCRDIFEYHPNQIVLNEDEEQLTEVNLDKIAQQEAGDTVRIIAMGDTQNFYDDVVAFVEAANAMEDIDFVVHQGDISDFGLVQEYRWVHDIMKDLKMPYLTVIGNHDLLANGAKGYHRMFGEFNYSFIYGGVKFVFLNTNGREYGFNGKVPDIGWLEVELQRKPGNSWTQAVIIAHMGPFSMDFDPKLADPYYKTLATSEKVRLSLYGHEHRFDTYESPVGDDVHFVTTSMAERGFSLIKFWEGGYEIEKVSF